MSQAELWSHTLRLRPLDPIFIERFRKNQEPSDDRLKDIVQSIDFVVPPPYEVWKPGFEWGPREFILITTASSREYFDDLVEQFQPDSYCSFVSWEHVSGWAREYEEIGTRTQGTRDIVTLMNLATSWTSRLCWNDLFNAIWMWSEYDVDSVLCNDQYFKIIAPLSHNLAHDSPETEDFQELVLGHFLPPGYLQLAWQYRLARPWDWCLQSVIQASTPPPERTDVESASTWLRHRFLYESKFDHSEEAQIIYTEKTRRESLDGEWPRMPESLFNAMIYDLVKKAHIEPLENPEEYVAADRVMVVLPSQYYVDKFKERYGYAGSDDYFWAQRMPDRFLFGVPPKAKIAMFLATSAFIHRNLYWDPVKKAKRLERKWQIRRAANIMAVSFISVGFVWCNYTLFERFSIANAGAVYRRSQSFDLANKPVQKSRDRISVLGGWGPSEREHRNRERAAQLQKFQQKRKEELMGS